MADKFIQKDARQTSKIVQMNNDFQTFSKFYFVFFVHENFQIFRHLFLVGVSDMFEEFDRGFVVFGDEWERGWGF